jgi:hypothetical protein
MATVMERPPKRATLTDLADRTCCMNQPVGRLANPWSTRRESEPRPRGSGP